LEFYSSERDYLLLDPYLPRNVTLSSFPALEEFFTKAFNYFGNNFNVFSKNHQIEAVNHYCRLRHSQRIQLKKLILRIQRHSLKGNNPKNQNSPLEGKAENIFLNKN
jgi:hypothetical protein